MRKNLLRLCAALAALLLLAGCGSGSSKKTSTNMVSGFLFSFDQRAETVTLASQIKKNRFPVHALWCYSPDGADGTPQIHETDDEEKIREICLALSNAIILDNHYDLQTEAPYYIILTMEDGSECRFDFVSESIIRLSEQNYSIESDGNLWPLLAED